MEPAAVTLEALSQWFLHSLSPLPEPRRHAESSLSAAADHPGFALSVLRLAAEPAADEQIRLAAAVHFKNHLRSRWPPSSDPSIPIPEKDQIKSLIVRLMLSSTPRVRPQLGESLSIISSHDFPASWPSLLPELVSSLHSAIAAPDYSAVNGLLSAASSVFTKFRHSFGGDPIRLDLKYCLDNFAAPLLEIFLTTSQRIAAAGPPEALRLLLESQRLCCDIFYSLNSIELPEFFEDHMREWMTEFRVYLTTPYPAPLEADGTADALRAAVCDNLQLYMEKNEEEFKDYLQDFASAVWGLLMTPSTTSPSRDQLTVTAIRFLTTVSTSVHHALFGRADILQQICQSIVLPNVRIRDEDEELFEFNFVEYIRRDIEGSDVDTRRRIACELLKGIASHYKDQVKSLVSMQIQNMLSLYASNPTENWREKDCAIYLVISLNTKMGGGIVDIESFFTSVIIPELQAQNVNASPLLKAGALKFFTVFREQISKQAAISLLPHVIRFLGSESNVVHSYAANCIEKLLLVKDKAPSPTHSSNVVASCPRSAALGIDQILPLLMTNLFNALQFPDSQENPYVMKCIMRVLGVATVVGEVAAACIARLTSLLGDVCRNPKDPAFNHYLFEAMAALIRRSCEQDPSLILTYEASLFPVLQNILVNDITEFWPYAFQIFALLVETSRPPLSENYMQLFQVLLTPDTWKRSANAPALVRLLQAYLQKVPNELNSQGRLSQVLGIFNKLISVSSTEQLGFYVLNTLVENLGYDMISHYVGHIWTAIFTRLLNKRTVKFVNSLVIFMSLVLIKHGPDVLVGSMNAVQNDIFINILQQFWIPNLKLITERIELKLTSVASTRLLCESPALLDHAASELWGKLLDSIICQLCRPDHNGVEAENEPEFNENVGYSATFARLHYAGRKDDDPLKEISDPNEFLVTSLAKLSAASPGRFGQIIQQFVEPSNRTSLLQFFAAYKCTLI